MAKVFREKFDLSEEELQRLISWSQRGDHRSTERLLEVFDNLLSKYVNLLYRGQYSIKESTNTRTFLALYVKDPAVRYPLLKDKLDAAGYKKVQEVVRGLQFMVARHDEEDVAQTVRMAFLHCIQRYERTESKAGGYVPFAGYINWYLKFIVKRYVDMFLIDQNGRHTFGILPDEIDAEDEEPSMGYAVPPTPALEEMLGPERIDEFWVAGDTATYPFSTLSPHERQLLRWRYVENMKASEIAHMITEHPNTLRDHYKTIRAKLLETLSDM